MSRHKFELEVELDDELLAELTGRAGQVSAEPSEWSALELFEAAHAGLVDPRGSEVTWYGGEA